MKIHPFIGLDNILFNANRQKARDQIPGSFTTFKKGADAVHPDGDSIRIMEPDSRNPVGYVRFTNNIGQPLDVNGKPGSRATSHIPLDYVGPITGWPK